MANNPYIVKSDFVKITNQGMCASDPKFIATLINSATSPIDLIDKIEAYNETHKLNDHNRINYGISVFGNYITVISATKSGDFYKVVAQDYNGRPKLFANTETGKIESLSGALHTHFVPIASIMDVVVAGYDPDVIDPILNNKGVDKVDVKKLIVEFTNMKQKFNALLSAGELRNYIKEFNYTFKTNGYNNLSFEHNIEAYNLYSGLVSQYLTTIKTIVENSYDLSIVNLPENIRDRSIYFVDGDLKTTLDAQIKKLWDNEPSTLFLHRYESRYEELSQKTFTRAEVEWFKEVISDDGAGANQEPNGE